MKRHHLCWVIFSLAAVSAPADTTVNEVNRYAYGANVGWLDTRGDLTNGAVLGQCYCTGYVWGADVGWIGLGNGPANGWQYSNASAADWGVNHDGAGNLSGYAYGANIGWIAFEQSYGQPKIDLLTGLLSGHVWGANIGWISLSNACAQVQTDRLAAGPDTDGDGIPDAWEYRMTKNLSALGPGSADADADGVPDGEEYGADTVPTDGNSLLAITAYGRAAATSTVTWTVSSSRHYRLMEASALSNGTLWADSGLGLMAPGSSPALSREVVRTNAASFYRVRAAVPLSP